MKKRTLLKSLMAAALVCASVSFAADGAAFKGNPTSKVYHNATCRFYNAKGTTVEFKSEAEAVKAGYAPCKQCCAPKSEKKEEKKAAKKTESADKK
jgi:methylphosphotriester-DNA--protein-cysteine methyltransferase